MFRRSFSRRARDITPRRYPASVRARSNPPSLSPSVVLRDFHMSVRGWFGGRMRTFFIPYLTSCIIFMLNRGEMVFFRSRKRDSQGKGNLLLREARDIYIILLQFVLTVCRHVFRNHSVQKRRILFFLCACVCTCINALLEIINCTNEQF